MVTQNFGPLAKLTLAVFMGVSTMQSQAQQHGSLFRFTPGPTIPVHPNPEQYGQSNSLHIDVIWVWRPRVGTNQEQKLEYSHKDEKSLSFILEKVGTERTESTLTSARVLTEDALQYMNRDPAVLISPYQLATHRGESVFRKTGVQSLGDYLGANYHPNGVIGFFRETFLDNSYDKRIISPLSPPDAGNPGMTYARKDGIHV